jgi:hypothetical protein
MKTAVPLAALLFVFSCSDNSTNETKRHRLTRPSKAQPSLPAPIGSSLEGDETQVGLVPPGSTIDTPVEPTTAPTPEPTIVPTVEPTPVPSPASVDWNIDGQALATGTGCRSHGDNPDTFFISAGNDFSVVMDRLGMDLSGTTAPLAERLNCAIRVPVSLPKGFFVSRMGHLLTFSVDKSAQTIGSIALRTSLFSTLTGHDELSLTRGDSHQSTLAILRARATPTADTEKFCEANEATTGIFSANIAMSGQRQSVDEVLRMVPIDGQTLRLSQGVEIEPCKR